MKKGLLLTLVIWICAYTGFAQTVSIINKKFVVNKNASCPIYFNGANTPWDNWNDFGGNYDAAFWSSHFATLKANGINASRVWISCNGDVQPNINTDGTVTGVSAQFWANLDNFFQSAQANGIYIMATMMSFDHTKNTYQKYQSWRNMLNDQSKVQTYCDNYLVPFVNRYKSNPYLMSIDISNEIEWVAEDAANMKCSYAVLQRFVAMCASAVHNNPRTDGSMVLVTLGSAATKWNATKMRNGSHGTGWQNNPDGNKWSDAALKAQYNQTNAVLDYYSPHYYAWIDEYYANPFQKTPADFGIDDKPVLIGETPGGNPGTPNMAVLASYEALKTNGYQGHFPWTSNAVDSYGGIANFGTAAFAFKNAYPTLIYPSCASTVCQTPNLGSDKSLCGQTSIVLASGITNLTNKSIKWYKDGTLISGASSVNYTVTSGGTYKIEIDSLSGSCVRSDEVVIAGSLPSLDLGPDAVICSSTSVTLNAATAGTVTYSWKKNNQTISGAASATLVVTEAGTYEATVSASGCTAVKDAVVVTNKLLPAVNDTICQAGLATLSVSGGSGTYKWYDMATNGSVVGTGSTFKPNITATKNFYVEDAGGSTSSIGLTQLNTAAAIWNLTPADFGVTDKQNKITVASAVTLKALSVYPTATNAAVTIRIMNGTTVVFSKAFTGLGSGKQRLDLGFALTPGTYTIDAVGTTATLQYQSDGAVFPYQTAGSEIKFENTESWAATRYGMFFDWEIGIGNTCARSLARAVIDPLNSKCVLTCSASISTATPTTFCQGGSVTLTASAGSSYKWFNGTTLLTNSTQTLSATASGSYTVEVTNANTCKATSTATVVTVNALPVATITPGGPLGFCSGGSVQLTASAGSSYKWFNGTTQLSVTTQTYTATGPGNYTVEVTNSNNCKATSAVTPIPVVEPPVVSITANDPLTLCAGGSVTLTATAGNSYKWFNGTTLLPNTTQTLLVTTGGSYTVEVSFAGNCKGTSAATQVVVNVPPRPVITIGGPATFCSGGSVTLTASPGVSYKWFNGSTPLAATTQALPVNASGGYSVEVTYANSCKAESESVAVTVNPLPVAVITVSGPTNVCTGSVVALTASAGSYYVWKNSGTNVGSGTNATYNAFSSGNYSVEVTNANNCKATSPVVNVTISAATTWYEDADGDGKGDPDATRVACTQPAGYVLTAGDNCPDDPAKTIPGNCGCGKTENSCVDCAGVPNGTAVIDACNVCSGGTTGITPVTNAANCPTTGTVDLSAGDAIKIIPNPSSDRFHLILAQMSSVQVMSAEGKEVETFSHVNSLYFGEGYAKGVYVVQISNGGSVHTLRVIKQ